MAAAIDADFDGIYVEFGKNFLEVGEDACGKRSAIIYIEESEALGFAERSVEGEDIIFLFVAGIVTNGPVGDDEVGEGVARAPIVVAAIVDGLVEDEVDDGIGGIARALHGGYLVGGQVLDKARSDLLWSAYKDGFGGDGGELSFAEIGDVDEGFFGVDGDDGGIAKHAVFVMRLEDFDELVGDAAEAAGQDGAFGVAAGEEILGVVEADVGGSVVRGGAPIGRAENVPPLLDLGGVGGGEVREGLGVEFGHAVTDFHFEDVVSEFLEAGDDFFRIGELGDARLPCVGDISFVDEGGIGHVDEGEFRPIAEAN